MKDLILRIGRNRSVALITVASTVLSILITFGLLVAFGERPLPWLPLVIALVAPLVIAPLMSTLVVDLIFQIRRLEEEQRLLATYDGLTQVMMRRAFMDHATTLMRQRERSGAHFAVALMDLDHFKKINDTYGHGGGDEVLKAFSAVLRRCVRPSDVVGRLGGEEFAIALLGLDAAQAMPVMERIRTAVAASTVHCGGREIRYTMSAGVADLVATGAPGLEALIAQADEALYAAKEGGRNRVVISRGATAGESAPPSPPEPAVCAGQHGMRVT